MGLGCSSQRKSPDIKTVGDHKSETSEQKQVPLVPNGSGWKSLNTAPSCESI